MEFRLALNLWLSVFPLLPNAGFMDMSDHVQVQNRNSRPQNGRSSNQLWKVVDSMLALLDD